MTGSFPKYPRTAHMALWEFENKRDVRQALQEEIAATGSLWKAAKRMGRSYHTLRDWCEYLGIEVRRATVVVPTSWPPPSEPTEGTDCSDAPLLEAVG